jgi:CubicO group peptidase (beta-lactamase class C family)
MLKWVQIFLDAENPHLVADRYESILTAASRRASQHAGTELGTRLIKARPDVGGVPQPGYIASPYGYGAGLYMWFDEVLGRAVGHAGGLPGYGSHMRWFTQENFAVVSMGNKRYARMAVPIQETMNEMSRRSIGKRNGYEVPVTRELSGLAQSLVDIVNKWDDQLAGHIFSNNVPVDMSYARRAAQFASIIKTTGPLTLESITAETRARATVIASGPNGSVEIEFRRSPRNIPEIQHYEITLLK